MIYDSTKTKESVETDVLTQKDPVWSIILYNDDINTFDWVIECLVKYCEHEYEQASQCALIIHNNGKCSVKLGERKKLIPIKEALTDCGLDARVEKLAG